MYDIGSLRRENTHPRKVDLLNIYKYEQSGLVISINFQHLFVKMSVLLSEIVQCCLISTYLKVRISSVPRAYDFISET